MPQKKRKNRRKKIQPKPKGKNGKKPAPVPGVRRANRITEVAIETPITIRRNANPQPIQRRGWPHAGALMHFPLPPRRRASDPRFSGCRRDAVPTSTRPRSSSPPGTTRIRPFRSTSPQPPVADADRRPGSLRTRPGPSGSARTARHPASGRAPLAAAPPGADRSSPGTAATNPGSSARSRPRFPPRSWDRERSGRASTCEDLSARASSIRRATWVSTKRYWNTDISICVRKAHDNEDLSLPSEAQVARGPDPPPAAVRLEAEDPRLGVVEVVQGHLVRRHGGVPFRRPRVEAIDPDASLAVRHPDHAVRALVQLPPDRPAPVQLRQACVRHEPDDLPLSDRLAGGPHGPLEQLVGLAQLDVLVEGHRREAGE